MKQEIKEMEINGIVYVPKGTEQKQAECLDGMKYVIIRTHSAGVHAGYLFKKDGGEVTLKKARRIYYWDGAKTLSQLAMEGTKRPENCKFPCEVDTIQLQWIEIVDCTEKARLSIQGVDVWEE